IAAGDMDGDGNLDLVETVEDYFTGTVLVAVLWGGGDGTFSPAPDTGVNGETVVNSLALADFDGDNKLDLVLGGYSRTWIFLGGGNGYFQYSDLGLATSDLTVADLNADGKPDLAAYVIGSDSVRLCVLLGNGDGSFQTARSFPAAGVYVTAADV